MTEPVIERNRVQLVESNSGISFGGLVFDATVRDNDMRGEARTAVSMFEFQFAPSDRPSELAFNRFVNNGLDRVSSEIADVFLPNASHDNVVEDRRCRFVDLGTDNEINGCHPVPSPPNDAFADAIAVTGPDGSITGSNVGATSEPGEPSQGGIGDASIWYSWQAPADGSASFDTFTSDFDTVLGVYTGPAVDELRRVAANDDSGGSVQSRVQFQATAGTTYAIVVAGFAGEMGDVVLSWHLEQASTAPSHAEAAGKGGRSERSVPSSSDWYSLGRHPSRS